MNTQPDLYAYNAVLNCWASQGNGPRAELFFRDELERFEKPDVTSYNSIIHAYQNNLAKGEELLQEIRPARGRHREARDGPVGVRRPWRAFSLRHRVVETASTSVAVQESS